MKITKQKSSKKPLIAGIAIVVVLIAGGGVYAINNFKQPSQTLTTSAPAAKNAVSNDTSNITNQDNATTDTGAKNEASSGTNTSTTPSTPSSSIGIFITDASQYGSVFEVAAYANDVSSGSCSYTFSKTGQSTISRQTTATPSATTTSCATLDVPINTFPVTGTWNLTINYASVDGSKTGAVSQSITIK